MQTGKTTNLYFFVTFKLWLGFRFSSTIPLPSYADAGAVVVGQSSSQSLRVAPAL